MSGRPRHGAVCGRGDGEGTDPGRSRPRLVHAASEPVGGRHRPDIRHHRARANIIAIIGPKSSTDRSLSLRETLRS